MCEPQMNQVEAVGAIDRPAVDRQEETSPFQLGGL